MPETLSSAKRVIRSAFAWWLSELQATVPDRLQSAWHRRRTRAFLTYRNGEIRNLGPGGDDVVLRCKLASGRQRPRQATLRLRSDQALSTTLELPLAAQDHLQQLLCFEMDRLTPFHPNDVYFAHYITATDHERQLIAVAVHIAPASLVDDACKAAHRLGIEINRVELPRTDGGSAQAANLVAADPAKRRPPSRSSLVLALIAVVLGGGALLILTHWQSSNARALEQQVAAAKVEADESLALRQRLQMLIARQNLVVKRKIETPMIARLIAELTRLIPHQAYVTQLNIRDGVIHVHGYAETASELIGALAQSDLLHEPQFRSPLTREPHSSLERFHISMQVGQGSE